MEQNISYNELVQIKQDGKIGWLDFLLKGDDAEEYKQWCQDHNEEPTEENAELFVEMTDAKALELLATA
jgi:pyruvate-formate lyase-activating enzyme